MAAAVTKTRTTPLMKFVMVMVMVTMGREFMIVQAQSSCNSELLSLSPCLSYITGSANTPSQGCCSALANVVSTNASCLCQVLGSNNPLGIPINQTRALDLPSLCKVTTPPVSRCKGEAEGPASSPMASNENDSGSTSRNAGQGSKPTKPTVSSAGSSVTFIYTDSKLWMGMVLLCTLLW